MLEHAFKGPPFTVGVEEELMILYADGLDLAQGIETILDTVPDELPGEVKPELMKSVLEIATEPCTDVGAAGAQLAALRAEVSAIAERHGMRIGASGTHPFARWEDQEIVDRPRYLELIEELGWIAHRELIFGTHVHVGIDGPEKAIYVADGFRQFLPAMLGLSGNSPFWRGTATGMVSSRTPVFRTFPRSGVPPHYGSWEIFSRRVEMMVDAGAIEDYTYLWWDVRPHPKLGTVELRVFDQQTRLEHTMALTALVVSLAHRLAAAFDRAEPMVEYPTELIDDNKMRAAMRGIDGNLVDFRLGRPVPAREMVGAVCDELREHAEELGCAAELDGIGSLCRDGTGASEQVAIYERDPDMRALVREITDRT